MTARILDGNALAQTLRADFKTRAEALAARGTRPGLAVILVGEDPASAVYVRNKVAACEKASFHSEKIVYPADVAQDVVLAKIAELNADPGIHGILVQLPLPKHISERKVVAAIAPEKDVDGFTPVNVGKLVLGEDCYPPCTPHGIVKLIGRAGVKLDGADVVIVGRSNIVGKPLANLLLQKSANATVTVCHTGTRDLAAHVRRADIVVACAGRPGLVTADMIKPGACVIDVGVNRVEDPASPKGFRLAGDVDFEAASEVAGSITPVPGGVGPMTITMLLDNTVTAAERTSGVRN